jgi:hypothetical protein
MSEFKEYKKKGTQSMRPYEPGEDMTGVEIPKGYEPQLGGMIAISKEDPDDVWYVNPNLFRINYELAEEIPQMVMVPVKSSNLKEVGYLNGILKVIFNSSGQYEYLDVPEDVYEALLNADSIGVFFNRNIKSSFEWRKV